MKITIDINIADLAKDLCNEMNEDTLLKLIRDIDMEVKNWDFTEKLYKYFKIEMDNWMV